MNSEYAEDKLNCPAQGEAKKWLISSFLLLNGAICSISSQETVKLSHFFASQTDSRSSPTALAFSFFLHNSVQLSNFKNIIYPHAILFVLLQKFYEAPYI